MGGYNLNNMKSKLFAIKEPKYNVLPICPIHVFNVENCLNCFEERIAKAEDAKRSTLLSFNPLRYSYSINSLIRN